MLSPVKLDWTGVFDFVEVRSFHSLTRTWSGVFNRSRINLDHMRIMKSTRT
jgi:hypothetical protein